MRESRFNRKFGLNSYEFTFLILILVAVVVSLVSICAGRYDMSIIDVIKILFSKVLPLEKTWDSTMENVVFRLRLPRILAAFMVGSALAISGATYQGMFKNPLVSPDLLGVSSGACVGAALAILAHLGTIGIQIGAFLGGVLAVTITITMPKLIKNNSSIMLVLAGVIVGGFMSSIMGLLKYVADPETELAEIVYWTLGSLAKVDKGSIAAVAPAIIIAGAVLMAMRWKLNILSLGENEARTLGTNVNLTRGIAIVCSTVLTACSVCLSGTIGWVGLVVPHLGRMLVGPDNTKMLPVTLLLGGAFMVFVDTLARTLTGAELPLSILTGLIGAPFYFWLLVKQRMNIQ